MSCFQVKILAFYKQHSDAKDACVEALQALDDSKLDREKKMKLQKDLQHMLNFYQKSKAVYNDIKVNMHPPPEMPKLEKKNQKYPAISNAIEFR